MWLFRLIRLPNLIIIGATYYLVQYSIIQPYYFNQGYTGRVFDQNFLLTLLYTILIGAGGYIINDLVDVRADRINKPGKVIIEKNISSATATWLFILLTLAGIAIAGFHSYKLQHPGPLA